MTAHAAVRQSDLARVIKAARAVDPGAIVEVTRDGTVRIIPAESATKPTAGGNSCDDLFGATP